MIKTNTTKDPYQELTKFYNKKSQEPAGGKFFIVNHHKAPSEHGVWARNKKELIAHFNKIRRHFTTITEQVR